MSARVFTTRIEVDGAHVDVFGELPASGFARALQSAAVRASSDAGYPDEWYVAAGSVWIVRRTTLEIAAPARAGDLLDVSTWVADFRRIRSRRDYEVRRGDTAIARAHTDWVYFDRRSSRPARVPAEMIAAFAPDGDTRAVPRRPLDLGSSPAGAVERRFRVQLRDLDGMAHVNNATYLDYVAEAVLAEHGSLDRLLAEGRSVGPTFVDVEYLEEARHGEELLALAWTAGEDVFAEIRRASDGEPITRAIWR